METIRVNNQDIVVSRVYQIINTTNAEEIAEAVLNDFEKFERIPLLSKRKTYQIDSHISNEKISKTGTSNHEEEHYCKETVLAGESLEYLGRAVGYQIPLKTPRTDDKEFARHNKGLGKVDLITYLDGTVTLVEVKLAKSTEHPLKAFLEAFTYWKALGGENALNFLNSSGINGAKILDKAVVIIKNCEPKDGNLYGKFINRSTNMNDLFKKLNVRCFLAEPVENRSHIFRVT